MRYEPVYPTDACAAMTLFDRCRDCPRKGGLKNPRARDHFRRNNGHREFEQNKSL
jgi:hypothetical protein